MAPIPQVLDFEIDSTVNTSKNSIAKEGCQPPADLDYPPHYIPLRNFDDRYVMITDLGSGSFGNVGLAKSKNSLLQPTKFVEFKGTLMERSEDYGRENYNNKHNRLVAIKTMNKRLTLLNDYTKVKEVKFILALPYHPNLVQIYELFIDNKNFQLHIAMECMDQNLYQLMKSRKSKKFSEPSLKSILAQILNGMRHIHHLGYFHRDIKPENILVSLSSGFYDQEFIDPSSSSLHTKKRYSDNFVVKLADFGLAREVTNQRPYTSYVSTRWYRAPEILLRQGHYSRPVDVWAFGSVAAEAALFRPLFPGSDEMDQTWRVLHVLGTPLSTNSFDENYRPCYGYWDGATRFFSELGINIPELPCVDITSIIRSPSLGYLCDVVRACLVWDPAKRPSVDEICRMHYFKGTCVDDYTQDEYVPQAFASNGMRASTSVNFNIEQSSKLAGIGRSKLLTSNSPYHFREEQSVLQDLTEFATMGSSLSPVCTDPISSFMKGASTAYDNGNTFNQSDFVLGGSFQGFSPDQGVPVLTPDNGSFPPNDENEIYAVTPLESGFTGQFQKSIDHGSGYPSCIDPIIASNKFHFQEYRHHHQHENIEPSQIDLNANYHSARDSQFLSGGRLAHHTTSFRYSDNSPLKNFDSGPNNLYTSDFEGVLRSDDDIPTYEGHSDSNNGFFSKFEEEAGLFETHPEMREGNVAGDSFVHDPTFSEALYSKYNLRRAVPETEYESDQGSHQEA